MSLFGRTAAIIVIALVGKAAIDKYHAGKQEASLDAMLLRAADNLNARAPTMIDADTRLDKAVPGNKQFRYSYTLVNYDAADVSAADFEQTAGPMLKERFCTSKGMEGFVRDGVTVVYAYYGRDGGKISEVTITPSQCASA